MTGDRRRVARPIVLTFLAHYLPGQKSGGPVRSIANMVTRLGQDVDFRIVTSDRDALDDEPYPDVTRDVWTSVGQAQVFYASPKNRSLGAFGELMRRTPHDIVYLNSCFESTFTLLPLLTRRLGLAPTVSYLVAPRGEFSPGALKLKSWKKRLYMLATRLLGLYEGVAWHASTEQEARLIRDEFGDAASVYVAPNLPAIRKGVATARRTRRATGAKGCLRVTYLSRISPKKNLVFALEVLAQVSKPMIFDIYGLPDDQEYWSLCLDMIHDKMPSHIQVRHHGLLDHSKVLATLGEYDLFFLPTRGENYGHAIQEALSAGTPVLISDQTPWTDLEEKGIGWDLPLSERKGFVDVIERLSRTPVEKRVEQRRRAAEYASNVARDERAVQQNLEVFERLALYPT